MSELNRYLGKAAPLLLCSSSSANYGKIELMVYWIKESEIGQEQGETSAMKVYSVNVREKVLRAVDQGYPREEIVKLLGLSYDSSEHRRRYASCLYWSL